MDYARQSANTTLPLRIGSNMREGTLPPHLPLISSAELLHQQYGKAAPRLAREASRVVAIMRKEWEPRREMCEGKSGAWRRRPMGRM